MRRAWRIRGLALVAAAALCGAAGLGAQTGASPAPPAAAPASPTSFAMSEGKRSLAYSELGLSRAESLAKRLDALFELFNAEFRFDPRRLPGKLVVREFLDKARFDDYVAKSAGASKEDFVYLHYANPARRELVIFARDDPEFSVSLAHQAFIQYLKAFVANPPVWLRDGYAVYFESARWEEPSSRIVMKENLDWLETVKSQRAAGRLLPLSRLLAPGASESREALELAYPQSWAFLSFLLRGGDLGYTRFLWDSMAALQPEGSLEANQAAILARLESWYGLPAADKAFAAYLESRKTFAELIKEGSEAWNGSKLADAKRLFLEAGRLEPDSFVPPYYLGLAANAEGAFDEAEAQYKAALARGLDKAVGAYARGLNAMGQGKKAEAAALLAEAKAANPGRYGAKVDELLPRLK